MASINTNDVKKIARLARLRLSKEDTPRLIEELNKILHIVEQMNQENTDLIEPLEHTCIISQPLRADQVTEKNQREKFQVNATTESGLYLAPSFMESE